MQLRPAHFLALLLALAAPVSADVVKKAEQGAPVGSPAPRLAGVPVKNVTFLEGKAISQLTVLSVEKAELPASTFETPEGYTKRDLMPR